MLNRKIKKLIDKAELISFDIFDTIIERMVFHPSDVFDIVQESYNKQNTNNIKNFKQIRMESECEVRKNSKNEEVKLEEIYKMIEEKYDYCDIQKIMDIELKTEVKLCKLKIDNYDILNYCYKKNKKIIICSDMYLPRDIVEKILKNNGIKYEKIYLSSDIMKTKSKGSIFKYIIKDNKISPKKILHIGDNLKSDFINPKLYRIKSILLKNVKNIKYDNIMVNYAMLSAENDFGISPKKDYFYNFGYKYLGIVMLNFCKFLNDKVKNRNKIIFLAREGQFMKICFDEMYKNNLSKYMYVSRKSVSGSLLYYYDDIEKMITAQSLSPSESIETFLKRWDIINEETVDFLQKNNINIKNTLYDEASKKKLQLLLEELKIKSNSKIKNEYFEEYLEQLEFDNETTLVDIGWSGTMHDLIQKQLDKKNIKVDSYYLGVRSKKKNNYKHGFLFDGEDDDIEILSRSMTGFLEILFSANHGTTIGYKKDNKRISMILAYNDISKSELEQIKKIQKGCLDFIKKYKNDDIISLYDCYKESYLPLFDFCINPSLKDINEFKKFCVVDEQEYNLIGNRYGFKYIFHLKYFVRDYILSCWKNAYLKSIFKIRLPYNYLFKFAYKRRSKK